MSMKFFFVSSGHSFFHPLNKFLLKFDFSQALFTNSKLTREIWKLFVANFPGFTITKTNLGSSQKNWGVCRRFRFRHCKGSAGKNELKNVTNLKWDESFLFDFFLKISRRRRARRFAAHKEESRGQSAKRFHFYGLSKEALNIFSAEIQRLAFNKCVTFAICGNYT